MRADLVVARTAVAHAAWRGADAVAEEDIRVAAELALPHRRRRDPFDDPGLDQEQLDEALAQAGRRGRRRARPRSAAAAVSGPTGRPGSDTAAPQRNSGRARGPARRPRRCSGPGRLWCRASGRAPGRRSRARNRTGTVVSSPTAEPGGPRRAPVRTLLAAARTSSAPGRPRPERRRRAPRDREGREGNLVIFVVDASGVDGRPRPDVRGQRRGAVAAARRLPAPRQGRGDHVPAAGAEVCCCRRRRRCTSRRRLAAATPAGKRRWPRLLRRPRCGGAGATRAGAALLVVVLTDGRATGGPTRWAVGDARAAAPPGRRGCGRRGRRLRNRAGAAGFGRAAGRRLGAAVRLALADGPTT